MNPLATRGLATLAFLVGCGGSPSGPPGVAPAPAELVSDAETEALADADTERDAEPAGNSAWEDEHHEVLRSEGHLEALMPSARFIHSEQGVTVHGVRSGSLSSQMGIRNGDRIVTVDGAAPPQDLNAFLSALVEPDEVRIELVRRGSPRNIRVTYVEARSASEPEAVEPAPPVADPSITPIGEVQADVLANLLSPSVRGPGARVLAHREGGTLMGVRLFGIREGSLSRELGFENGDIAVSVNGIVLGSVERALEVYEVLRDSPEAQVVLVRRGLERQHTYRIVPSN